MKEYSIYEAKAKFSEVVRTVLDTGGVVITQRGVPVIQIFPFRAEKSSVLSNIEDLKRSGRVQEASHSWKTFKQKTSSSKVAPSIAPGALARFLDERE